MKITVAITSVLVEQRFIEIELRERAQRPAPQPASRNPIHEQNYAELEARIAAYLSEHVPGYAELLEGPGGERY